jgi:hypothetical protein
MSRATVPMRDLAERLIACETQDTESSQGETPPAFQVCDKLRPYLATLAGKAGFQALLSRALAVASAEVSCLRGVQAEADGTLSGWGKRPQSNPEEDADGSVLLVAELLSLLVAFIGEDLTLRLVSQAWPELDFSDLDQRKRK